MLPNGVSVPNRFLNVVLIVLLVLLAAYVAEPYFTRTFFAAQEPRVVAPRGDLAPSEQAVVELFERISPSVVHVYARPARRGAEMFEETIPGQRGGVQSGTGFVWDQAGHVVTNNHVVQGGAAIAVRLAGGDIVPAQVVGTAPNYDLAVLRLGRVARMPPPVPVGTSADLRVGQAAFAIGNPFGLDQTLTTGVISALQRRLPTGRGREIADVIQTDAAINPGNSGGPLLDSAGRVIGVNTAIFSPSGASAGIGFAVPIDVVNRVVPELIRTGRVPSPGIGIIAAAEEAAAQLGVEGVVIVRVLRGSPADKAGLVGVDLATGEIGDVIIGVNGRPVRRLSDLTQELERVGVGRPVELTVDRDGSQRRVRVDVADVALGP